MKKRTYSKLCNIPFLGAFLEKMFQPVVSSLVGMNKIIDYEMAHPDEKFTIGTQIRLYKNKK